MQGTGFLFVLLAAARKLFPDRQQRIEFLHRHSRFFNAQPYCASLALGQTLRREFDLAQRGQTDSPDAYREIIEDKENLCGVLGLLGDQLFWQLLKPLAAALGMIAAIVFGASGMKTPPIGALVFLLVFNPPHLWMRWWGLKTGYDAAYDLTAQLGKSILPPLRRGLSALGPYLALVLTVVGFTFVRRHMDASAWISFLSSFWLMSLLLKQRVPLYYAMLGVALLSLLPVAFGLE